MFPTARNSLRRWSEHYHNKIPIPIAVTLHNLLIHRHDSSHQPEHGFGRRLEHNRNLLPALKLEIVVQDSRIVYSESINTSVHPSWEHLDERMNLQGEWWLEDSDVYKTMKLRFLVDNEIFMEVPIYPPRLQKLTCDDDDESKLTLLPNSCLIYFSDGSTRLPESIFRILEEVNLTKRAPIEDFSRFEDDVFSTLDSVPQTPERRRLRSDSLLDYAESVIPATEASQAPPLVVNFDQSEQQVLSEDLQLEAGSLHEMIAQEEQALEEELISLKRGKENLGVLLHQSKELKGILKRLNDEIHNHSIKVEQEQFARQAQRTHLLRSLETIYPISIDPQKGFLIRNLRLPVDIKTTAVPDEELSASLGFACHLIFMMSKYLHVGLRHRLFCNSSRSVVQQDGSATVFPLFAVRGVEREQLDAGLGLLGENVDCLLLTFEIAFTHQSHILQRLKGIYEGIIMSNGPKESE